MKTCPFCAEEILDSAIKCKHCQSMLDGSDNQQEVTVTGKDPFAEYHTPIQGRKKGSLTGIGYMGIVVGILFILFSGVVFNERSPEDAALVLGMGVFFLVGCYMWARKTPGE
jgi:hypothetical protein